MDNLIITNDKVTEKYKEYLESIGMKNIGFVANIFIGEKDHIYFGSEKVAEVTYYDTNGSKRRVELELEEFLLLVM